MRHLWIHLLLATLAVQPTIGTSQIGSVPTWTDQFYDSDFSDRKYEIAGTSYFRPEWYRSFSQASEEWNQRTTTVTEVAPNVDSWQPSKVYTAGTASGSVSATPYISLTSTVTTTGENGWIVFSLDNVPIGSSVRVRGRVWLGSNREDNAAGSGLAFYLLKWSEYLTLGNPTGARENWHAKTQGRFPDEGIGATILTKSTAAGEVGVDVLVSTKDYGATCDENACQSRGWDTVSGSGTQSWDTTLPDPFSTDNPCKCYKFCQKITGAAMCKHSPTVQPLRMKDRTSWDTFEMKINHTKVTIRYNGKDSFDPLYMPGSFTASGAEKWVVLIGATTDANNLVDNQRVDDVEISYWTPKRVPFPPYELQYVSSTTNTITINWTPHEDDGGAPVRWYRIVAYSVNATCSWDEGSPDFSTPCTYYNDYGSNSSGCATQLDAKLKEVDVTCEVPGFRRATMYMIQAYASNVVGMGSNMTTKGYPELLVTSYPTVPVAPAAPTIVQEGATNIKISWPPTTDNGGAFVVGYVIYTTASPAPPSPGSPNTAPPAIPEIHTFSASREFTVGVDQAYDSNHNPITVILRRYTNYAFRIAATNRYQNHILGLVGGLGLQGPVSATATTLPTTPDAPTWAVGPLEPISDRVWERPGHRGLPPLYPINGDASFTASPPQTCWWPCRMKMQWVLPADDGGRRILYYKIYRGITARTSGASTVWEQEPYDILPDDRVVWIVDGLLRNTIYSWKITGINQLGEGAESTALTRTSANTPDVINLAYQKSATQSTEQQQSADLSMGGAEKALDGLTNPNFDASEAQMTNYETANAVPFWRVDLGAGHVIREIHLFFCGRFTHKANSLRPSCSTRVFDLIVYDSTQTEVWRTSNQNYIEGTVRGTDMLDTGYDVQGLHNVIQVRLDDDATTGQLNPHMVLAVGPLPAPAPTSTPPSRRGAGHLNDVGSGTSARRLVDPTTLVGQVGQYVEIKTTATNQVAMAEVRVFGWHRGCNDEYTCESTGSCLFRKDGQDYRKCVCASGYEGETCADPIGTAAGAAAAGAVVENGTGAATYIGLFCLSLGIALACMGLAFGMLYCYYRLTLNDAYPELPVMPKFTAKVTPMPEGLPHDEIRKKYHPGFHGASSQAKGIRKKKEHQAAISAAQSRVASRAPTRGPTRGPSKAATRRPSVSGIEDVETLHKGASVDVMLGRAPPCGFTVGWWRILKDRWKFVIVCGFAVGGAFFVGILLVTVLNEERQNQGT